jgi:hypothetical protein
MTYREVTVLILTAWFLTSAIFLHREESLQGAAQLQYREREEIAIDG